MKRDNREGSRLHPPSMPRDLAAAAKEDSLQGMPVLTKSPDIVSDADNDMTREAPMDAEDETSMIQSLSQRNDKRDELHPYTSTLAISDVESCTRLEAECFPPNERCTKEKVSSANFFSLCFSHVVLQLALT